MSRKTTIVSVLSALCVVVALASATHAATSAGDIFKATGVQGGMVVHLGCGDGKLTAALHSGGGFLIQGRDADAANVDKARKTIAAAGLYGKVSVSQLNGTALPYIDGLVNLVVAEELGKVSQKLGEKMYADMQAQQAGAAGAAGAAEGAAHAGGAQQAADDVVDAEFKEVKKD